MPTRRLRGRSSGSSPRCEGFLCGVLGWDASLLVRWADRWVERFTSGGLVGMPWLGGGMFSLVERCGVWGLPSSGLSECLG